MRFTETGADSSVAIESGSADVICERSGMPLPPTTAVSCLLSESSFSAEAFRVVAASPNEDCTSDRLPVMSPDRPDMLVAVAASPSMTLPDCLTTSLIDLPSSSSCGLIVVSYVFAMSVIDCFAAAICFFRDLRVSSALAVPSVIFLEASPMLSATFCRLFCVFCAC